MVNKSWLVTLTPLLIAILQLAESYLQGDGLTGDKLTVFLGLLLTFLGSGTLGVWNNKATKITS
jgi:hypothetical protein